MARRGKERRGELNQETRRRRKRNRGKAKQRRREVKRSRREGRGTLIEYKGKFEIQKTVSENSQERREETYE